MANGGDSEVKELLALQAADKVNRCFSGTVNVAGKGDVTQMATLSASRISRSESRMPAHCEQYSNTPALLFSVESMNRGSLLEDLRYSLDAGSLCVRGLWVVSSAAEKVK